jgi:hypothetical protein
MKEERGVLDTFAFHAWAPEPVARAERAAQFKYSNE